MRVLRTVLPPRTDAFRSRTAHRRRTAARRPHGPRTHQRMRAHLFDRKGPRPGAGNRTRSRPQRDPWRLDQRRSSRQPARARTGHPARQRQQRRGTSADGRQRSAAAPRPQPGAIARTARLRLSAQQCADQLCRRVGILARQSRSRLRRRRGHRTHAAILGELPGRRGSGHRTCRTGAHRSQHGLCRPTGDDRRDRLAERRTPARRCPPRPSRASPFCA